MGVDDAKDETEYEKRSASDSQPQADGRRCGVAVDGPVSPGSHIGKRHILGEGNGTNEVG